jgi:hypothetical protein
VLSEGFGLTIMQFFSVDLLFVNDIAVSPLETHPAMECFFNTPAGQWVTNPIVLKSRPIREPGDAEHRE